MKDPAELVIREEMPDDIAAIDAVIGPAFRAAFDSQEEVRLVHDLRRDRDLVLSLVAEEDGEIVGTVQFCRAMVEDGARFVPAVILAPVAVAVGRQKQGIGSALIRAGLKTLAARGEDLVFLIGHPTYYGRFGFDSKAAEAYLCPWSKEAGEAHQVVAIGADDEARPKRGRVHYPAAFARFLPGASS